MHGHEFEQALACHRRGDLQQAQQCYERLLAVQPEHAEALNFLGILLQQRGQSTQAEQMLRRALRSAPGYAAAYTNLGNVLVVQKRFEEAIAAYRQALRCRADEVDAALNLGALLRGLGRLPEGLAAYRQASASRPDDAAIQLRLGTLLAELGEVDEALSVLHTAWQARPADADLAHQIGTLLHSVGRNEEARMILGNTVFQLGDDPAALRLLQHWLRLLPDDPIAQHRIAAWFGETTSAPPRASDAYVTYLFDRYAEGFDAHLLEGLRYRAPQLLGAALAELLGPPAGALTVLDAGCGTGLCGPLLRPYAWELVGVDLSPRMLDKARARGGYDQLVAAELTLFLSERPVCYELIVSADTLVYFGDLAPVLMAAAGALRPGGWLAFTVEALEDPAAATGFRINPSGRYNHSADYVRQTLAAAGLTLRRLSNATLRQENDQPMVGYLVLADKPGAALG